MSSQAVPLAPNVLTVAERPTLAPVRPSIVQQQYVYTTLRETQEPPFLVAPAPDFEHEKSENDMVEENLAIDPGLTIQTVQNPQTENNSRFVHLIFSFLRFLFSYVIFVVVRKMA